LDSLSIIKFDGKVKVIAITYMNSNIYSMLHLITFNLNYELDTSVLKFEKKLKIGLGAKIN